MDVGEDTTLRDGDVSKQFVQFLVVADGKLKVTWDNTGFLVVTGSVACQFKDFCSKIFEDCGKVDGGT